MSGIQRRCSQPVIEIDVAGILIFERLEAAGFDDEQISRIGGSVFRKDSDCRNRDDPAASRERESLRKRYRDAKACKRTGAGRYRKCIQLEFRNACVGEHLDDARHQFSRILSRSDSGFPHQPEGARIAARQCDAAVFAAGFNGED